MASGLPIPEARYPCIPAFNGSAALTAKAFDYTSGQGQAPTYCQRSWWELRALLCHVAWAEGSDELLVSKRINNYWATWLGQLAPYNLEHQMVPPAASRAKVCQAAVVPRGRFHLVGTCALLALAWNWVCHARDQGLKRFASAFLQGLAHALFEDKDFEVTVEIPDHAATDVVIDSGKVWLPGLLAVPRLRTPEFERALMQSGLNKDPEAPIMKLLHAMAKQRPLQPHVNIITRAMAKVAEASFDTVFGPCSSLLHSNLKLGKRSRMDYETAKAIAYGDFAEKADGKPLRVHSALAGRLWKGLRGSRGPEAPHEEVLLRYFLSSRLHFHGAKHLSVAMDAGRIGKKDLMCAVVVGRSASSGTPVAACMPPQVIFINRTMMHVYMCICGLYKKMQLLTNTIECCMTYGFTELLLSNTTYTIECCMTQYLQHSIRLLTIEMAWGPSGGPWGGFGEASGGPN